MHSMAEVGQAPGVALSKRVAGQGTQRQRSGSQGGDRCLVTPSASTFRDESARLCRLSLLVFLLEAVCGCRVARTRNVIGRVVAANGRSGVPCLADLNSRELPFLSAEV